MRKIHRENIFNKSPTRDSHTIKTVNRKNFDVKIFTQKETNLQNNMMNTVTEIYKKLKSLMFEINLIHSSQTKDFETYFNIVSNEKYLLWIIINL